MNKHKPDGLQGMCRGCSRTRSREYYKKNGNKMRSQILVSNAVRIRAAREFVIEYLIANPCTDCGETDVIVLEFDHVRGTKRSSVSQMVNDGCGINVIREEIQKCEVRCANCHRRKTATSLHHRLVAAVAAVKRKKSA